MQNRLTIRFSPPIHSNSWRYSTLWKFILNFVSVWDFSIKFWSYDSNFHRNFLTLVYLNFETPAHAESAFTLIPHTIILHTFYKFLDMYEVETYILDTLFIIELGQWFYQFSRVSFFKNLFRSTNCAVILLNSLHSNFNFTACMELDTSREKSHIRIYFKWHWRKHIHNSNYRPHLSRGNLNQVSNEYHARKFVYSIYERVIASWLCADDF